MQGGRQTNSWIFISHSSVDLPVVRRIRNYLEDQGAAPLLFHLLALKDPEEFWPIIKREIEARNFFLLCDSPAARASDWVRREKDAVERLRAFKPVRVERIDVSAGDVDPMVLDELVRKTRVFTYHNVPFRNMIDPYIAYLAEAGFEVADISPQRFFTGAFEHKDDSIEDMLKKRYIVYFCWSGLDRTASPMDDALMSAKDETIFVFLDQPPEDHPGLQAQMMLRAWEDPQNAPAALIEMMMWS